MRTLSDRQTEGSLRAQLYSLATLLSALPAVDAGEAGARHVLAESLKDALRHDQGESIVRLARELARQDAQRIPAIDWTVMNNG